MKSKVILNATLIYYFTVLILSLNFSLVTHCWGGACTLHSRGCSNFCIILRTELQVPYKSGINAAKFQRKIMTATPQQMPFYVCT